MFKKFLFQRSLNAALLELGIDTDDLNPAFRDEVMEMALREHFTPQEAALAVLALAYPRLSLVDRLRTIQVVRRWRSSAQVSEANYQHTQNGSLVFERPPSVRHA